MKAIGKSWRDSATLMVVARRAAQAGKVKNVEGVNYDILLQTRTRSASFPNSVVFPGGVSEPADDADDWLAHYRSFGFTNQDFEAFHCPDTIVTPVFQDKPVQRHISLRITAIRETFEELGLLLCSTSDKKSRSGDCASVISDLDVKSWQQKISKEPKELLTLCKELKCYPDIWSLHYWSNWLTPVYQPRRFAAAFFVAAVSSQATVLQSCESEVTNVEWIDPVEVLYSKKKTIYPPQFYELLRLTHIPDIQKLIKFAKERSCHGEHLLFPVGLDTKDGRLHILPGDELYPSSVDYNNATIKTSEKTSAELRRESKTIHRLEVAETTQYVFKNYKSDQHINMGDRVIPANVTVL